MEKNKAKIISEIRKNTDIVPVIKKHDGALNRLNSLLKEMIYSQEAYVTKSKDVYCVDCGTRNAQNMQKSFIYSPSAISKLKDAQEYYSHDFTTTIPSELTRDQLFEDPLITNRSGSQLQPNYSHNSTQLFPNIKFDEENINVEGSSIQLTRLNLNKAKDLKSMYVQSLISSSRDDTERLRYKQDYSNLKQSTL